MTDQFSLNITPVTLPCWGCGSATDSFLTGAVAYAATEAAGLPAFSVVRAPICRACYYPREESPDPAALRRIYVHAQADRAALR